jgi:hypothetical protein
VLVRDPGLNLWMARNLGGQSPMRAAALIWLACLAIYLELLWRHRSHGRARGPLPWSLLALIVGGLVTVLWIVVLGGYRYGFPELVKRID